MKKVLATALSLSLMASSACESTPADPPAAISSNESGQYDPQMWNIGKWQMVAAKHIGNCSIDRGGIIEVNAAGELIYRGPNKVGAGCRDGSIIDPNSVNLADQARIYDDLAAEVTAAAQANSWRAFTIHDGLATPIGVGTTSRAFAQVGDICRVNSSERETTLHDLGKLSTGETLVQVDPNAIAESSICAAGTYFLLSPQRQPQ